MTILLRNAFSKAASKPCQLFIHSSTYLKQIASEADIIISLTNYLHKGLSWNTLTPKFKSVQLTDHLIQKMLLQLKEPLYSRKALNLFHWSAKEMHFQHGISTYCMMIHILVRGRLIKDAKALLKAVLMNSSHDNCGLFVVLNSLLSSYEATDSTAFVFDLLVRICAKLKMVDNILLVCKTLLDHGFRLHVVTYNTLLHVIQTSESTYLAWSIYYHMIDTRVYPNEMTMKIMISVMCKEGKLKKYLDIVDSMHGKRCSVSGQIVNTCLIYDMIMEDRIDDGLVLLKHMLLKNIILDTVSYSLVILAKVKMGDLVIAQEICEEMLKRGFTKNVFVCSLFVGANCGEGKIDEAIQLLEEMETSGFKPPVETFNSLIKGCSKNVRLDDSLTFCKKMVEMGLVPNPSDVNEMFGMLSKTGRTKDADDMLTVLLAKGFTPDENTFSHLIDGYCRDGDVESVFKLLFEMEYRSISLNMLGFTSLITSLSKLGRLNEAYKFLKTMKTKSLVPYEIVYKELISGYLQKGDEERAHQLYRDCSC